MRFNLPFEVIMTLAKLTAPEGILSVYKKRPLIDHGWGFCLGLGQSTGIDQALYYHSSAHKMKQTSKLNCSLSLTSG